MRLQPEGPRKVRYITAALSTFFVVVLGVTNARAEEPAAAPCELLTDFHWAANTLEADGEDIVTSPLRMGSLFAENGLLRQRTTYYTLLGAGVALGGAFALDETVRAHLHTMPKSVANGLQDSGGPALGVGAAALYGYGLYVDDENARQFALTAGESALLAGLATQGVKVVFGRQRPNAGRGAFHFFSGGQSFVSGHATPAFAAAAALSEYFDNEWYALLPAYTAAFATGFGRIGNDAHWLSDVIGAGLVGVGTTELLLYLHREHAQDPSRFRIFPMLSPSPPTAELAIGVEW
jgi:membrane-associated phospholipid phosphatase